MLKIRILLTINEFRNKPAAIPRKSPEKKDKWKMAKYMWQQNSKL